MHRPFLPCLLLAACLPAIPEERPGAMLEEPPAPEGGGEPDLVGRVLAAAEIIAVKTLRALADGRVTPGEVSQIRAEAFAELRGVAGAVNVGALVHDVVEWVDDRLHRDPAELRKAAARHAAKGHDKRATKLYAQAAAFEAIPVTDRDPTEGDQVLYRVGGTDEAPELRPALVVKTWGGPAANLQVFIDGSNDKSRTVTYVHGTTTETYPLFDAAQVEHGNAWKTSVPRGTAIGQWRWPARA